VASVLTFASVILFFVWVDSSFNATGTASKEAVSQGPDIEEREPPSVGAIALVIALMAAVLVWIPTATKPSAPHQRRSHRRRSRQASARHRVH
jgi:UDP-N-acetylmuramyl pentapeptide phosphotransferase/UDP-N-acetylglucosamine-1-phosphate transferase